MENLQNKDCFLEGKKIVLALSGGIDSIVLLHYLHTHYQNSIRVIHCNHHISKYSAQWEKFCANLCQSLNIDYSSVNIFLKKPNNIEENARKQRYYMLSSNLQTNEILCTAHHQNDQAETLLLQLFRGSGVAGLASMPKLKTFAKGMHYRPLLNIEKSKITQYAKYHNLSWVEDDSNTNTNFRRNFLRLNIFPELETICPNLAIPLSRSAKHQSEALKLIQDLAKADIEANNLISNNKLDVKCLAALPIYRIKNIIRYHLLCLDFLTPSDKVMQQILTLLCVKQDAVALVRWGGFEVRRYQNALYFINQIINEKNENFCPYYDEFKKELSFSIRYRSNGQRIKLPNKKHSQSLKKTLQQANIPPWERNTLRMYYIGNKLCAMERIGYMSNSDTFA